MTLGVAILPEGLPEPEEVEVIEALHQPASFRLRFAVQIEDGDLALLTNPGLGPETELSILVPSGEGREVLVKGPVTGQLISLEEGGEGSRLDVLGADPSAAMDREDKAAIWSSQTDSGAVTAVLGTYGLNPDVSPTATMHTDQKHALVQRETDLAFVRRLARRNGYWFWISTDATTGLSTAHFKRPPVDAAPALELRINRSAETGANVESASIRWNTEAPVAATLTQLDLNTKSDIDGTTERSPLAGLADNALADLAPSPRRTHLAVPVDDAGDLGSRAEAVLIDGGWLVQAQVKARASVLGQVVRAHTVVTLSGAGSRHSGRYLVARVAHRIDADDHTMTIDLIRNGWN